MARFDYGVEVLVLGTGPEGKTFPHIILDASLQLRIASQKGSPTAFAIKVAFLTLKHVPHEAVSLLSNAPFIGIKTLSMALGDGAIVCLACFLDVSDPNAIYDDTGGWLTGSLLCWPRHLGCS